MEIIVRILSLSEFCLLGELFQNNHHHAGDNANFARKWFEFDPTYLIMRGLNFVGIIKLKSLTPVPVEKSNNIPTIMPKKTPSYSKAEY